MINYMDRATLSIALPVLSADLGLSGTAKGVLTSAFFWSYALMQIPIGWCADRFDLRWLYAGMFAIWSFACGLTGFAGSLAMLIVLRIVLGFGESIYLPGGIKVVSLLFAPKDRGLPSGLFDSGTRTGLLIDGLVLPWLIVTYGWRHMFMLVGFSSLIWILPWLAVYPRNLQAQSSAASSPPMSFRRLAALLSNRNLRGICIGFFCFDYFWYLLLFWLTDFLVKAHHLPLRWAALYAALAYLLSGACEPLGGWIADTLIQRGWDPTRTRKRIVAIGFLCGLMLIPAAMVKSTPLTVALTFGAALVGLSTANLHVILQSCAPHHEVSVWTGVENFAGNLAGALAMLVMGKALDGTGSYLPGFAVGSIVLVLGSLSYLFVVGELKQTE